MANTALTLSSLAGVQDVLCYQDHGHQFYRQQVLYKETKKVVELYTMIRYLVITGAFHMSYY